MTLVMKRCVLACIMFTLLGCGTDDSSNNHDKKVGDNFPAKLTIVQPTK